MVNDSDDFDHDREEAKIKKVFAPFLKAVTPQCDTCLKCATKFAAKSFATKNFGEQHQLSRGPAPKLKFSL
jgi:hypothetical protein